MIMKKINLIIGSLAMGAILMATACNKDEETETNPNPNPEPTSGEVKINELISKDTLGLVYVDDQGDEADWCELYNPGDKDISIAGYFIGDDGEKTDVGKRYEIPSGSSKATTIPAKGYLILVWGAADANGDDMEGIHNDTLFIPSGLKNSKDVAIAIWDANGKLVDVSEDFSEGGPLGADGLAKGKSLGRKTDGDKDWVVFDVPTPGKKNQ
jgi:hypothetical protein